jgi:hypothetical protein
MTAFSFCINASCVALALPLMLAPTLSRNALTLFFAVVLAHVLAKEIETLCNVRDPGLLFRELQTSNGQELPDRQKDFEFEHIFRCAGHSKVE